MHSPTPTMLPSLPPEARQLILTGDGQDQLPPQLPWHGSITVIPSGFQLSVHHCHGPEPHTWVSIGTFRYTSKGRFIEGSLDAYSSAGAGGLVPKQPSELEQLGDTALRELARARLESFAGATLPKPATPPHS